MNHKREYRRKYKVVRPAPSPELTAEAFRLAEDIQSLRLAIEALKTIWPDNIQPWPIKDVDARHEAEMELWNEIRILQRWLRRAEDQARRRFLAP